jgi:hypothetical protein
MPLFSEHYTPEQRAAIERAVLDVRMTHAAAARAAASGELGVTPFEIARRTVSHIASTAAKRRLEDAVHGQASGDPLAALRHYGCELTARTVAGAERLTRELDSCDEMTHEQHRRVQATAKSLRELALFYKMLPERLGGDDDPRLDRDQEPDVPDAPDSRPLLQRLADEAESDEAA